MCEIKAKGQLNGHQLNDLIVINPGDWFGKTYLIEIGGNYSPLYLVVEADTVADAIDELADNEQWGHLITVPDEDLDDYDPDDCHFGPNGQVLDLDWLLIHGQEGSACPFPCRYFGDGLPEEGMKPTDYWCRDDEDE
jgi:hypothetical protein